MVTKRSIENMSLALAAWGGGHLVEAFEELVKSHETLRRLNEQVARGARVELRAPALGADFGVDARAVLRGAVAVGGFGDDAAVALGFLVEALERVK